MYTKGIHFWNKNESENSFLILNFIKKNLIVLRKCQLGQATKSNFEYTLLKFHENHAKTNV